MIPKESSEHMALVREIGSRLDATHIPLFEEVAERTTREQAAIDAVGRLWLLTQGAERTSELIDALRALIDRLRDSTEETKRLAQKCILSVSTPSSEETH